MVKKERKKKKKKNAKNLIGIIITGKSTPEKQFPLSNYNYREKGKKKKKSRGTQKK